MIRYCDIVTAQFIAFHNDHTNACMPEIAEGWRQHEERQREGPHTWGPARHESRTSSNLQSTRHMSHAPARLVSDPRSSLTAFFGIGTSPPQPVHRRNALRLAKLKVCYTCVVACAAIHQCCRRPCIVCCQSLKYLSAVMKIRNAQDSFSAWCVIMVLC